MMRALYFDCGCGVSGDMVVGALIDAGASFDAIRAGLDSLGVPGFTVSADRINKRGIMATQFRVHVAHEAQHPHRNLREILDIIERGQLPANVKANAAETFRRIAECEARIHGAEIEKVHFHEVGAVDSIADIVGAHHALHLLGVERVTASPLNLGSGTVETAHGVMPVPAPATVMLLKGIPCYGSEVRAELVTPTGAALIAQCAGAYGTMPEMRVEAIGCGSGTRDLPDRANVLRAIVGELAEVPGDGASLGPLEAITVIEVNIDDMNPELLPPLIADLLAKGARDAFLTPLIGKKGRPAHLITVLCDEAKAADLVSVLFAGSTTLGVRMRHERRVCLAREWKRVETPWGAVRIKIGRFRGRVTCASPEFEDCRRAAEQHGVSVLAVYEAARVAAAKGEMLDA